MSRMELTGELYDYEMIVVVIYDVPNISIWNLGTKINFKV